MVVTKRKEKEAPLRQDQDEVGDEEYSAPEYK